MDPRRGLLERLDDRRGGVPTTLSESDCGTRSVSDGRLISLSCWPLARGDGDVWRLNELIVSALDGDIFEYRCWEVFPLAARRRGGKGNVPRISSGELSGGGNESQIGTDVER